jgi:hypothetical protein
MRKYLFTLLLCCASLGLWAQAVPNPSFELWESDTTISLRSWYDSNLWSTASVGRPNVSRSATAAAGLYAVRMETIVQGADSILGYVGNSPIGSPLGAGGFAYAQQPDTLHGWVKHNLLGNDSAVIAVVCKAGGLVLSTDMHFFTGLASNYTYFELPLTVAATPDSISIVAISALPGGGSMTDGSWLMLDGLGFNTSGQVPDGGFEQWLTTISMEAIGWTSPDIFGDTAHVVTRSTDAITGQYALSVQTKVLFGGQDTLGYATTGIFASGNQVGGQPYNLTTDTLCGWYKYSGISADSAIIGAVFFQGGVLTDVAAIYLESKSFYDYFEIPIQLGTVPDTVRIDIWSSNPGGLPQPGSVLLVDSLRFKSDPLVGLSSTPASILWQLFPSPSNGQMWLQAAPTVAGAYNLEILNVAGQRVYQQVCELNAGLNRLPIDLYSLPIGVYVARLQGEGYLGAMRIVVE